VVEVASELQHRVRAARVVRGEKGVEAASWHAVGTPMSRRYPDSSVSPAAELVDVLDHPFTGL
jgi:hypothetical protein